ncbi:MAG: FKBP-type peptidyl-prolyl cis-trans isomerase [Proteobacteria bacterium]|nr:FKBP-type peptidyl-prolyl cis-trans isomerase [Pseudomonadota bacterium]
MTQFLRKSLLATAVAGVLSFSVAAFAQAPAAKPAAPSANKAAIDAKFKNEKEKFGYLVGTKVGENLAQIKGDVDQTALIAALQDSLKGAKAKLTPEELNEVNQEFMQKLQAERTAKVADEAKKNQAEGDAFLAKNKAKAGVKTTASGLQYEVVKEGTGPKPKATDTVKVDYVGTKINGEEFDASAKHGGPATFQLNGVIPGWTEGVQLMTVGSKYKFYIPAKLAYGENGPGPIGPNATLVFDVTLLAIEPPAPAGNDKSIQPVEKPSAKQ